MQISVNKTLRAVFACAVIGLLARGATATTLRVVTWNIDADTTDFDVDSNGKQTGIPDAASAEGVFSAMGAYKLGGNAQAPDVIALQELFPTTTSGGVNTNVTLSNLVSDLNTIYGAGTYAYNAFTDPSNGSANNTGNGPSGLIYKVSTVSINNVTTIGSPATDDVARTPLRYSLQVNGVSGAAGQFYLYNDHYKALGDSDSASRRTEEADLVRSNADSLGANAHIIFTGDMNLDSGSAEQAYKDLTAASGTAFVNSQYGTNGQAGVNQAIDTVTSTFTNNKSSPIAYATDSATSVSSRLDLQLITAAMKAGTTVPGLQLVPNTQTAFGNTYYNGSTLMSTVVYDKSVAASTNTGNGLSQAVLTDLTQVTDHLPVIADYTVVVPEPTTMAVLSVGLFVLRRQRR